MTFASRAPALPRQPFPRGERGRGPASGAVRPGLLVCALLACGGLLLRGAPAAAYVRARTTDTFVPLHWTDPVKAFEVALPPNGVGISDKDLRSAAQSAATSWSFPAIACTAVALRLGAQSTESQVARFDRRNRIIMRAGAWCRDPDKLAFCHDPAAVALTTMVSAARPGQEGDGEILDADIEVNTVDAIWGLIADGPISGRDYANVYDLASVLTHEMGHFIGLDHNCQVPEAPLLIDDQGVASPSCGDLPANRQASIQDATMFPFTNVADVRQRTLSADDQRAACEMYPFGAPPVHEWVGAGGCSHAPSAPRSESSPFPLTVLSAAGLALFVRRIRRRGVTGTAPKSAPTPRN